MIHYLLAFAYGLALLGSFVGWGSLVALAAGRRADASLRAAWGVAFCIALGGLLNLFGLAFGGMLIVLTIIGLIGLSLPVRLPAVRAIPADRLARTLLFTAVGILALRYAASVSSRFYNAADDYQGYFVFPEKLIQTGTLDNDPFSERRIISSLGGQSFLDAMLLSAVGPAHLNLLDRGIGLLLLAGLAWGLATEMNAPPRLSAAVLIMVALVRPPQVNITSLLIASAMFLALYRTLQLLSRRPHAAIADGLLAALVLAAVITLKTNLVPAAVFLVIFHFILRFRNDRRRTVSPLATAGITICAAVVFLLAWMIDSFRSNGTLFYPILGHGYYGTQFGDFRLPSYGNNLYHDLGTALVGLLPVLLLLAIVFGAFHRRLTSAPYIFALAALLATAIAAVLLGGFSTERFTFAFDFAAVVAVVCYEMAQAQDRQPVVAILAVGLVIGNAWTPMRAALHDNSVALLGELFGATAATDWQADNSLSAQFSVPAGQRILERLDHPFLLTFRRNPILIADVPGNASPPPGMPLFAGPTALSDYLIHQNIRYVAYSYADQAGFSRAAMADRLRPDANAWVRASAQNTLDFQRNLAALARMHKPIYDDGNIWVIDLEAAP